MKIFQRLLSIARNSLKTNPIEEISQELRIRIDNDTFATVDFEKVDENTYDLVHTAIPESLQGQGLGHILAERIFDHLIANKIKLKLTCEFLQEFYTKNAQK